MYLSDTVEAFVNRAAQAELSLRHVMECLQAGPGTAIAYHEHRGRPGYRVLHPYRFGRLGERDAVIVWGHADIAEEMVTHRHLGESMDELHGALADTAFDYLIEWYEQGPVPITPTERVRDVMNQQGFALNRRSDRWTTSDRRIMRDHFVYYPHPYITVTAKHTFYADGRVGTLLRAWDLGRQIKGVICTGDATDTEGQVRRLIATAKARVWG